MRRGVLLLLALAVPALAGNERTEVAGLRFAVPKGWERVQPTSPMRAAQFRIPRAGRKQEDGELIVVRFDDPKGGEASDFVARWYAQFTQPDGRPSKEAASVTKRSVNGLDVEIIDLGGTYRPALGPMDHAAKPGWRLLGAVVAGQGGPWYLRAVGPAATIKDAEKKFDALVDSLEAGR